MKPVGGAPILRIQAQSFFEGSIRFGGVADLRAQRAAQNGMIVGVARIQLRGRAELVDRFVDPSRIEKEGARKRVGTGVFGVFAGSLLQLFNRLFDQSLRPQLERKLEADRRTVGRSRGGLPKMSD